jgi:hypothetical protein
MMPWFVSGVVVDDMPDFTWLAAFKTARTSGLGAGGTADVDTVGAVSIVKYSTLLWTRGINFEVAMFFQRCNPVRGSSRSEASPSLSWSESSNSDPSC